MSKISNYERRVYHIFRHYMGLPSRDAFEYIIECRKPHNRKFFDSDGELKSSKLAGSKGRGGA